MGAEMWPVLLLLTALMVASADDQAGEGVHPIQGGEK